MDRLWAPWRIKYIKKPRAKICIFCKYAREKQKKEEFVLKRTNYSIAVLNLYPYNNGHLMVAPKRHIKEIKDLTEEEVIDIYNLLCKFMDILKMVLKPEGFNIGINIGKVAGAGIEGHLHIHIVPRWEADTNFMSTVAETKVISQSLKELARLIKKKLK